MRWRDKFFERGMVAFDPVVFPFAINVATLLTLERLTVRFANDLG